MENVSEFIRQNGAFGVLVLLIGAGVKWGLPYIARRLERMQEEHDRMMAEVHKDNNQRIDHIIEQFDNRLQNITETFGKGMAENTKAIESMGLRLGDVEHAVQTLRK